MYTTYPRQGSLDTFYLVTYYIKWVKTSWTYSLYECFILDKVRKQQSIFCEFLRSLSPFLGENPLIWRDLSFNTGNLIILRNQSFPELPDVTLLPLQLLSPLSIYTHVYTKLGSSRLFKSSAKEHIFP